MDAVIGRELDLEDLYTTPDDGNRYEILDGALVMTPVPSPDHQYVVTRLVVLLNTPAREHGMTVLPAPTAWRIGPGQVPEPDVIVAPVERMTSRAVEGPPALVVEILAPTGRPRDLYQKRRIYADGGAAWYWIVDPTRPVSPCCGRPARHTTPRRRFVARMRTSAAIRSRCVSCTLS